MHLAPSFFRSARLALPLLSAALLVAACDDLEPIAADGTADTAKDETRANTKAAGTANSTR